uniref:Cytochrome p450 3043A1 n=2 Tax=Brachionus TaxID=10194 RepID=W8RYS7_9BILA|nr:cytochrome p450 3043A1 [Brachionus koreanus]
MSGKNLSAYLNKNIQLAILAFSLGLISYAVLKRLLRSKYKLPDEICFDKKNHLGKNKKDFLNNLQQNHEQYLTLLQQAYPNECCLSLNNFLSGSKKIVFLNSIESVKKFSQKVEKVEAIADRPKNLILNFISKGYLGSFFRMFGPELLEIRKSSLQGLHSLITKDSNFEQKLTDELQLLIDFIDKEFIDHEKLFEKEEKARHFAIHLGKEDGLVQSAPIYLQQIATNYITNLGLGIRFDYDSNPEAPVKVQIKNISESLGSLNLPSITNFDKINTIFSRKTINFLSKRINSFYDFLSQAFGAYKSNYDPEVINTFADFVLNKHSQNLNEKKILMDSDNYSEKDILVQYFTLMMAGTCTTGFTLSWALYYLSKDMKIQEEIFNEIVRTVGTSSFIYSKQRSNLPYTEACLNEILRLSSTQALIPRSTANDVQINDYNLPKDTTVLINAFAIHRDPRYWNTHNELHPEQWFDENKNLKSFNESFIPFGVAPRTCIGDNLSKQILFLVVVNLVQRFHFEYVPDKNFDYSGKDGYLGVLRKPFNYHLKLTRRS